jgi:hypothetical protein
MSEFHFGIPREDWLRMIVNRADPTLFRPVSKPGSIRALSARLLRPSGRGDLTEKWLARRDCRGRLPKSRFSALLSAGEQSSSMKSWKPEIRPSGTVRGEDGNVLIFSPNERIEETSASKPPLRASILSNSFRRRPNSGLLINKARWAQRVDSRLLTVGAARRPTD